MTDSDWKSRKLWIFIFCFSVVALMRWHDKIADAVFEGLVGTLVFAFFVANVGIRVTDMITTRVAKKPENNPPLSGNE